VVALDEWGEDLSFGLYSAERSGSVLPGRVEITRNSRLVGGFTSEVEQTLYS